MARYVKISTVGAPLPVIDHGLGYEQAFQQVKNHLLGQVAPVLPDRPDLIVLPEACDIPSGYDTLQKKQYIANRGQRTLQLFAAMAKENHCNIAFTTYQPGQGDYNMNTTFLLDRQGEVAGTYSKNYPVPMEYDDNVRCGTRAPVIQLDFGRVACAICYDLNMDPLRLHYKAQRPELIIFSSMFHGALLQRFWAQSCRAWFVGAIANSRPSAILSPQGETVAYSTNYRNYATGTVNLDYALVHYDYHYEKLAALKTKYGPAVEIFDPGDIGYLLITSESDRASVKEMLAEFALEELDAYLERSIAMRDEPGRRGEE